MTPEIKEQARKLRNTAKFEGNPHLAAELLAKADALEGLDTITPIPALPVGVTADAAPVKNGHVRQCPACASEGHDATGNHLLIWNDGGFSCAVFPLRDGASYPERDEHRAKVRELLGMAPAIVDPLAAEKKRLAEAEAALIAELAKQAWEEVKAEFAGPISSIGKSGKLPIDFSAFCVLCDQFDPGDLAWTGTRHDKSEEKWAGIWPDWKERFRFRDNLFDPHNPADRAEMWQKILKFRLDHTSFQTWKPTAGGRDEGNWKHVRRRVVEHDGPKDNPTPLHEQVALIRFTMSLGWDLRYVLDTGGKGIHANFDVSHLSPSKVAEDVATLLSLGADPNPLNYGKTRTPGCKRRFDGKTPGGKYQEIVWIAP